LGWGREKFEKVRRERAAISKREKAGRKACRLRGSERAWLGGEWNLGVKRKRLNYHMARGEWGYGHRRK